MVNTNIQMLLFLSWSPQMEDDSLYNLGQAIGHPFPPPLPEKCAADPSDLYQVRLSNSILLVSKFSFYVHWTPVILLYQVVQRHSHYPPIIQTNTCCVAVPFKEQRHHRTPCESIGNNYSPKAQDLKIDNLSRQHPSCKSLATATGSKRA